MGRNFFGIIISCNFFFLGKRFGLVTANLIGLSLCGILDFIGALYIFTKQFKSNFKILFLFVISLIIGAWLCQIIFKELNKYLKYKQPKYYKLFIKYVTVVRSAIATLVFIFFSFPFRRFIIFSEY